jgi:hypothetical protein
MPIAKPHVLSTQLPGDAQLYELPLEYWGVIPADGEIVVRAVRPKNEEFAQRLNVRRVAPDEASKRTKGAVLMIAGGVPGCRYEIRVGDAPAFQLRVAYDHVDPI